MSNGVRFLSADTGKTIARVLNTHLLQTMIKLHCFGKCWPHSLDTKIQTCLIEFNNICDTKWRLKCPGLSDRLLGYYHSSNGSGGGGGSSSSIIAMLIIECHSPCQSLPRTGG